MKVGKFVMFCSAIAAFAIVTAWQYYNEDYSGFETARKQSSDRFLESALGSTRYRTFGDQDKPTIFLINGSNGFLESWEPNIESLVKSGYRVIAYDIWGRGLSSRPRADLSMPVFREQLDTLIHQLKPIKVILMGSSFGCVIAADYALSNPSRVEKLVLVSPAGWPSPGDNQWIKLPIIGDLAFHYFGRQLLRPKVEAYFFGERSPWAMAVWDQYASYPGYTRAVLSTLRHAPVTNFTEGWRQLGALPMPMLFIWGKQDVSFPYANKDKVAALIPQAQVLGIDNAAHWVNIEKSAEVNVAVGTFLRK